MQGPVHMGGGSTPSSHARSIDLAQGGRSPTWHARARFQILRATIWPRFHISSNYPRNQVGTKRWWAVQHGSCSDSHFSCWCHICTFLWQGHINTQNTHVMIWNMSFLQNAFFLTSAHGDTARRPGTQWAQEPTSARAGVREGCGNVKYLRWDIGEGGGMTIYKYLTLPLHRGGVPSSCHARSYFIA